VPYQENPVIPVQDDGADTERHATVEPPIEMKDTPQQRLQSPAQFRNIFRHRV
jgi:hypothetical protein